VRDAFPLIADADLVKIDIEGGEWPILADARFASMRARAVVLEYHIDGSPSGDPAGSAAAALTAAGFVVGEPVPATAPGYGTLWAWRAPDTASPRTTAGSRRWTAPEWRR
jgi:hypothetical protein